MLMISRFLIALFWLSISFNTLADYSTDQIEMAATGRFDLLETSLEELARKSILGTKDQHALCYAYSKTKRYSQLMVCLDQLEKKVANGDRRTRLFGLADATPTIHIMRAEAMIELGQYSQAVAEAQKAYRWLVDDDSDDFDMFFDALAAISIAESLRGNEDAAWKAEKEIAIKSPGSYENAKSIALARARMALKYYPGVISAIDANKSFGIHVFLDRLVSGSFLTGVNNWVWAELPRAFMLNKALLEIGETDKARAGFDQLLNIDQVKNNGEIYWLLLSARGRIAELDHQVESALNFYRRAIDVIENQRASINTEASKIGFVGDKQIIYSRIIDLASQLKQNDLVFEYIERSKSRALIDLLASRGTNSPVASRDENEKRLLDAFQNARNEAAAQLPIDMAKTGSAGSRMAAESQAESLRKKSPELASLVTVEALKSSEMMMFLRPDEVLIEYSGFGDALYGLAMNGKQSLTVRLDGKQIEAEIRQFREEIQKIGPAGSPLAKSLYQQLIKPFESVIGERNLLLIPHGALHYLPFAALHDGNDSLIGKRNLRLLPSISVEKYIRKGNNRALENGLIFGNPDLGNPALALPSAEVEAKDIATVIPKSQILTGKDATETAFKSIARNFGLLHIASHGQFKSDNALQSRLLLAADSENDGSLTVRELYEIRLNADLVTLSACETGLGKVLSGDDMVGLARGFLFAGASNVVASLWEVDDEATSILMKTFYTGIKRGQSKIKALRHAQLELAKKYKEPNYWAAFYLMGNGI